MWDKLIRSMFQGNTKTKVFLWSILIMGMAALAMLVIAVALGMPYLGMGGVALGFVSFITSQSVSIDTLEHDRKNSGSKNRNKKDGNENDLQHKNKKKKDQDAEEDEGGPKSRERQKARFLASLNEKSVKKMLREHKVVQAHVQVMIDSYAQRKLSQVPAFAWRTEDHLHFLVLEGHANEFEIPLEKIQGIYYEKDAAADPDKDYAPFQYETFIAKYFGGYLPEYHEYTNEGELSYRKNLFRVGSDVYITNTSMANMMSILPRVPFLIDDSVCRSERFDEYFKELYRYSVLCKNQVISLEDYKMQIEKTLDSLLEAPISPREYVQTMHSMARYHLIERDHVAKYSQKYRSLKMQ